MPFPSPTTRRAEGFSLVELLVAMVIASIIAGVAMFVLSEVQRGARLGIARAQLSLDAQAINSRVRFDAGALIGPSTVPGTPAGALVIIPAVREGYVPLPGGGMSKNKVRLRSDQLGFIADQTDSNWMNNSTPPSKVWSRGTPGNLHSGTATSRQAVVWYGAARNTAVKEGDGTNLDVYHQAHKWVLGRQAKLLADSSLPPVAPDFSTFEITPARDEVTGSLAAVADAACTTQTLPGGAVVRTRGGGWSLDDYLNRLAHKPADQTSYVNLPETLAQIGPTAYHMDSVGQVAEGVQWEDIVQGNLHLAENCSEFVVQWAGDLDKDGNIDIYPPGHPLAGSIVWYPEEIHAQGSWYDTAVVPRMDAATADLYANQIKPPAKQWYASFPTGFTGPAPVMFNGHGDQSANWHKGFQFNYGEHDNAAGQATAPDLAVPQPYVFKFGDGQWRSVRFGFRQDGAVYNNAHNNKIMPRVAPYASPYPAWNSAAAYADGAMVSRAANGVVNDYQAVNGSMADANGLAYSAARGDPYDNAGQVVGDAKPWILLRSEPLGKHWFPYPPRGTTAADSPNPTMAVLYANKTAPIGPFPLAAPSGTTNFADGMGNRPIPYVGQPAAGPAPAPCRQPPTNWLVWRPQAYAFGTCVRYPTRAGTVYYAYNGQYPQYDPAVTYNTTTNKYAMEGGKYYHTTATVTGNAPSVNAGGVWVYEGTAPLPPAASDRPDLVACKWAPVPYPITAAYGGSVTDYSQGTIVWYNNWPYCSLRPIPGAAAPAWDPAADYANGTLVSYAGATYWSKRSIPSTTTAPAWAAATAYPAGSFVSYVVVAGPPATTKVYYCNAAVAAGGATPDANVAWVETYPRNYAPLWDPEDIASSWRQITPPPYGYRINVSQTGASLGSTGYPATGSEPVFIPNQNPLAFMEQKYGDGAAGDNYTVTYKDLWREYLQPVNEASLQGTRADWRNPQSDWPRLIRMRARLHDPSGLVVSYADDFLVNGRDNDGDGRVNNPEEGRMSGIWYEFVFPVPYPRDPNPRNQTK